MRNEFSLYLSDSEISLKFQIKFKSETDHDIGSFCLDPF